MKISYSVRKPFIFAAAVLFVIAVLAFSGGFLIPAEQEYSIKVAVLYSGASKTYLDTYQHFSQPLLMNLKAAAIDADRIDAGELTEYDLVCPDISIRNAENSEKVKKQLIEFVAGGGAVLLENSFYDWFPMDFLGAGSFEKLDALPDKLEYPEVRYDLKPVQRLINDFYENYKKFRKRDELKADYGRAMVAETAVPVVKAGDTALYTLNYYGKGFVFFTNPLLPNNTYISGFDMTAKTDGQAFFNNTVAAANQMLGNEYAAFLAKQKYGYALKKVFGSYGRPAMAWQNHFEVLSAVEGGSLEKWIDITREYDQIPSYSLARGLYEWGVRYESIGYFINKDDGNGLSFESHEEEAFYAAGRHPVVDNRWLTQKKCEKKYDYFVDIGDLPDRAYPYVEDLDGDGVMDIVSGSSDGFFYCYKGLKYDGSWILDKPEKLASPDGRYLETGGFSSPVLYDLDGDGYKDLVTGGENGKISWYKNNGKFRFSLKGQLVKTASAVRLSAPDIGDMDGDEVPDLVVGTKNGTVYFFQGMMSGKRLLFKSGVPLRSREGGIVNAGANAAPKLIDLDGDGQKDLAVGAYDGYIRKFRNDGLSLSDMGYFDDSVPNYLGNFHIKSGNNAVPAFADLNGDGRTDMIAGRLEFGMAVAIDSPWFPYKKELADALKYAEENYVSIEPHVYTNRFISPETEQQELAMHKKAFEAYGLRWDGMGTNQHTWRINNLDPLQTLMDEYESGLCWNSAFEQVNSGLDPANGTESTWLIPFYLLDKAGKPADMIIFNPSPSLDSLRAMYQYSAAWDTPVSFYQHSEYAALQNPEKLREKAEFLDRFRDDYDYNFMTEEQMMKSFAAALNTGVKVRSNPVRQLLYAAENGVRTLQQFEITIEPVVKADGRKLLDGPYKNVAGVKVEAGEKYLSAPLDTDADIYARKGRDLYVGLNKAVKVYVSKNPEQRAHIERINLPAEIVKKAGGMDISILDGGMQQIKLYVPGGGLKVGGGTEASGEWKVENAGGGTYILTRYGGPTKLELSYSE